MFTQTKSKILGTVLSGILSILFLSSCEETLDVDEDSLVRICVKTGKHSQSCASGFWVTSHHFLTAEHVVHKRINEKLIVTVTKNGEDFESKKSRILRVDTENDLALIEVRDFESESWLRFCDRVDVFDQVYIARIHDNYFQTQYGYTYWIGKDWVYFTFKAWGGWSGSPIINSEAECVASVLKFSNSKTERSSGGPKLERIKFFLENNKAAFGGIGEGLKYRER